MAMSALLVCQKPSYLCICLVWSPRGRSSTDVWVGRCGWGTQTLTLFKTEISDFPTLSKTASRFFRLRLNTFNQNSLSCFVVMQASGIGANKKGCNFGFLYHIYKYKCTRGSCSNVRITCLRQKVIKSIPRLRQKPLKTIPYLAAHPC